MKSLLAVTLFLNLVAAKVSYDGYKAFRIDTKGSYDATKEAIVNITYVSLSCEDNRKKLEVAVAPGSLQAFNDLKLSTTLISNDVGADIASEGEMEPYDSKMRISGTVAALPDISYFNSYHALDQHHQFLADLAAAFPSNSEVFTAGNSVEGRPLRGIHLWGQKGRGKNPAIIWHGTVHAREWIVAPTVEYMAYRIIQGYQNKEVVVSATLDKYDIYIMPIVNPDGFVYTTTSDRLWRKNRQRRSGQSCVGTDVNRNWPYQWNIPGGSSTDPCSETYRGQVAGDAPENRVLVNHTISIAESTGIKFYVDWHSFSQLILLPYGYSCSAKASNLNTQTTLAAGVSSAIKGVNGLTFQYGPTCSTIYQTAGGSNDYVQDVAKADLAWAVELRPTSSNGQGFAVPASNILPSGKEIWAGMSYLFSKI